MSSQTFQRFTILTALIGFLTALASDVLQGIPVGFNTKYPIDPLMFLTVGSSGAGLLRWGSVLDMLGYYLPFLPIVLFLHYWLRTRNPVWVGFYSTCAVGYIFIGAVGAVTMAVIQPLMIQAYAQAAPDLRPLLEALFRTTWTVVYAGLWNILAVLLMGVWFVGVGLLLRSERRGLAIFSLLAGMSALADCVGNILGIELLAMIGLLVFLLLVPLWLLWFGIEFLRKPVEVDSNQFVIHLADNNV